MLLVCFHCVKIVSYFKAWNDWSSAQVSLKYRWSGWKVPYCTVSFMDIYEMKEKVLGQFYFMVGIHFPCCYRMFLFLNWSYLLFLDKIYFFISFKPYSKPCIMYVGEIDYCFSGLMKRLFLLIECTGR